MRTMHRFSPALLPIVLALTLLAPARVSRADWPAGGVSLTGPSGSYGGVPDFMQISRDPSGDILVTWQWRYLITRRLHAIRLTSSGAFETGWPTYGLDVVDTQGDMKQTLPDGVGGFFEASVENPGTAVFARHVLPNSLIDTTWPVIQSPTPAGAGPADAASITSDGSGGAFITWMRSFAAGFYAAHIRADGVRLPAHGAYDMTPGSATGSFEAPLTMMAPAVVPDGAGGMAMAWLGNGGACMAHLSSTGVSSGAIAGLGPHTPSSQYPFAWIVRSGVNEYICAWVDTVGTLPELVAQRLDGDGNVDPSWPVSGLIVAQSTTTGFSARAVSDGADGILLGWSMSGAGVHALHLLSNGTPAPGWPAGGVPVGDGSAPSLWEIAPSDAGGLLYAGSARLWWYLADGTADPATSATGVEFVPGATTLLAYGLAADGENGAYVVWDHPYSDSFDAGPPYIGHYGHGTTLAAGPGVTAPAAFALRRVSPNPALASFSVDFTLASDTPARLQLLDVAGRRVRELHVSGVGEHSLRIAQLQDMRPGVYLVRLIQGADVRSARIALLH